MLASSVLSLPTSTAAVGRHDLDKRGKKYVACFTKTEVLPDVVSACDGQWTPEAYPGFYKSGSPYLYIPKAVFDENNACGKWVTISNPIKGGARTGLVVGGESVYFEDAIVKWTLTDQYCHLGFFFKLFNFFPFPYKP